jgi:pyrophosphatase PpaX
VAIKGILFDMDGTLVNTNDVIMECYDYATRTFFGHTCSHEDFIKYYGIPLAEGLEALFPGNGAELCRIYREHQEIVHDDLVKAIPGMIPALKDLQGAGLKMVVVTSKLHRMAKRALGIFDMLQYFQGLIGREEVVKTKPDAEPSLAGLKLLNLPGNECLCVGDSPFDLISGKKAGCTTVAVGYSLFNPQQMERIGHPDYKIQTPAELLPLIKKLNTNI